ncbi:hypothetical protein C5167_029010 [Papaver somniferum]|nr:hypothetical protein C5167_029010 [Papaver somniferum]
MKPHLDNLTRNILTIFSYTFRFEHDESSKTLVKTLQGCVSSSHARRSSRPIKPPQLEELTEDDMGNQGVQLLEGTYETSQRGHLYVTMAGECERI